MQKIEVTNNIHQSTDEWYCDRLGKITSSQLSRIMTNISRPMSTSELAQEKINGGKKKNIEDPSLLSESSLTYINECVSEILTNKPAKSDFVSFSMQRGIELEPVAIGIYEAVFDTKVTKTGFIKYSNHFGGSPDGLIGDVGVLEVKCPSTSTHLKYLKFKSIEDLKQECKDYYYQMIGHLITTGAKWCDFISYNEDYQPKHQLKRLRVERKDVETEIQAVLYKIEIATKEIIKQLEELK